MDDSNSGLPRGPRLKAFEDALNLVPEGAHPPAGEPTIAIAIQAIREHAQAVLKMCDEADRIITDGQGDARAATDALLHLIARVK